MKGDVLIVDDAPSNRLLLEKILKKEGYQVRSAVNGTFALTNAKLKRPDLVLMDINMPDMDGYQACRLFQTDPSLFGIPIIFISDLSHPTDKVKAFKSGGADYIPKPFQPDEVLARIEYQLTIQQQQQEIEQQNQLLAQSNQRLEEFAFLVAHDLKQPLQSLMRSGDQLKQQGIVDDVQAQQNLANIEQLTHSMHQLVEGLLDYSRVGAGAENLEPIDCQAILNLALTDLQASVTRCQAKITVMPLPIIRANSVLLLQLFQNLIGNALKFKKRDIPLQIEISAEPILSGQSPSSDGSAQAELQSGPWRFEIRDNGIGIRPEKCRRMFEIFQRCHTGAEYPGHGIGLSTCQKIVEHHGGKIWASSRLGEGTSIYFTLSH